MKDEVTQSLDALKDGNIDKRLKAIEVLEEANDSKLIPYLIESLGDIEWRVRKSAISALVHQSPNESMINQLISIFYLEGNTGKKSSSLEALVGLGTFCLPTIYSHFLTANAEVKKFLVEVVGEIGDVQSLSHLLGLLKDPDENIRLVVIEALGKLGSPKAVDALLVHLRKENPVICFAIIKALAKIGDRRAGSAIVSKIHDPGLERVGIEALGLIGEIDSMDSLTKFIEEGSVRLRSAAIASMAQIYQREPSGSRESIIHKIKSICERGMAPSLLEILGGEYQEAHLGVVLILGWVREKDGCKALIPFLDGPLRAYTIEALAQIGDDGVQDLIASVQEHGSAVREGIAVVLGKIRNHDSVQTLIGLLGDENGHVRESAALSLGKINDPVAIPSILSLFSDPYPSVQESAAEATTYFTAPDLVPQVLILINSGNKKVRRHAIGVLGKLKSSESISKIIFATKDEEPSVRKAAFEALGVFEGTEIDSKLILGLADEDQDVRLATLSIITQRVSIDLVSQIGPLLQDPNMWLRTAACRALGRTQAASAKPLLIDMLKDEVGVVQIAAIESLILFNDSELSDMICDMIHSPDVEVIKAAVNALGQIGKDQDSREIRLLLDHSDWGVRAAAVSSMGQLKDTSSRSRLEEMMTKDPDRLVRQSAEFSLAQLADH